MLGLWDVDCKGHRWPWVAWGPGCMGVGGSFRDRLKLWFLERAQVLEQSPDLPLTGYRSLGKSLSLSFLSYKVGDNNTIPSYTIGLSWGSNDNWTIKHRKIKCVGSTCTLENAPPFKVLWSLYHSWLLKIYWMWFNTLRQGQDFEHHDSESSHTHINNRQVRKTETTLNRGDLMKEIGFTGSRGLKKQ